jgi:hypothetical protein
MTSSTMGAKDAGMATIAWPTATPSIPHRASSDTKPGRRELAQQDRGARLGIVEHGAVLHDEEVEQGEVVADASQGRELAARDEQQPAAAGSQPSEGRPRRVVDVALACDGAVVVHGQGLIPHAATIREAVTNARRRRDPPTTGGPRGKTIDAFGGRTVSP